MARVLTKAAKDKILDDTTLYSDLCVILKVKGGSLSQLLYRNSAKLVIHDAVIRIASAMDKCPDEILESETVTA